jgi:hypothetical protein
MNNLHMHHNLNYCAIIPIFLCFFFDILSTTKEMVSTKSSTKGPGRPKGQGVEKVDNITSKRKREQESEEVIYMCLVTHACL